MNLFENRTIASLAEYIRSKSGTPKKTEKKKATILEF
jgi:hypothetical protein